MASSHHGSIVGQHNGLTCIFCQSCRFRHLDPIPSTDLYASGVYHSQIKPAMVDEHSQDAKWWAVIYGDWLVLIDPLIPNTMLLDVGAGTGQFVDAALAHNRTTGPFLYDAHGIEADTAMALRHAHITNIGYADYNANNLGKIGIISAHWTMEHFSDPIGFLSWAHNALADKGVLLVTIPNDFSSLQESAALYLSRPAYWLHHTHINYWSALEFPSFLSRHGFKTLHAYGSWEPEQYLMQGLNYLDDHTLGRSLHSRRMEADLIYSRSYRIAKYLLLGQEGRGRDCTFVAVKQ